MILDASTVDRDLKLEAEVCVIGSGAGGSVVAHELAAAGRSVVVLEEGAYWTSDQFSQREEEMYPKLYRERGTKPTTDHTVLVSQGRALGGSTLVSFCLCFRTPAPILEDWRQRLGLSGSSARDLRPHFDRVERFLGVRPMGRQDLNTNNRILRRGARRLALRGRHPDHNRTECLGCGYCALGCTYDRKGDALTTYLAAASRFGARILPEVRAERILHDRRAVSGVEGVFQRVRSGRRYRLRVEAPVVVLAAGAIESPLLWLRSELPDPKGLAGGNLHLHPYAVVAGLFDEPIRAWEGIPQSYVVDHFLDLEKQVEGGFLAFAGAAPPVTAASLLPGLGADHRRLMRRYESTAAVAFFLHDRSTGRVRADKRQRAVVSYRLNEADQQDVLRALRVSSEILFAAGARSVVLPYNDLVEVRRRKDVSVIEERGILANDPLFVSFHPQGTLRMGSGSDDSLVDSRGAAHDMAGLYVADASIFPTSVAVPPQLSVMAFAERTAHGLLAAR